MKLSDVATKLYDVIREVKPKLEQGHRAAYGEFLSLKVRLKELEVKRDNPENACNQLELDSEVDELNQDLSVIEGSMSAMQSMLDDCNAMTQTLQGYMLFEFIEGSNPELD